jgi:hypothetical protein
MEGIRFSETLVRIRSTQRYTPEDDNSHNYGCENIRSYKVIKFYSQYESTYNPHKWPANNLINSHNI